MISNEETMNKRNLMLLAVAKFLSGFAGYIYDVGIVIYLYEQTGSETVIGGFFIAQLFPAFITFLAGAVIDRYNKRNLMVCSQFMKAAAFLLLLFDRSIWSIYFVTFIINLLLEFEGSTFSALMTSVFSKKHLLRAASVINVLDSVSMVLAPFSASLVAIHFNIHINLLMDIALFSGSAGIYLLLQLNAAPGNELSRFRLGKIDYNSLVKDKRLLKTVVFWNLFMLCIGITAPLEISMIGEMLGMPSSCYGFGNTIEGIGMLAASGIVLGMVKKLKADYIILIGLFSAAFSYLMIGTAGNIWFYFIGAFLVGMTAGLCPLGFKTEIQMRCGQAVVGQVFVAARFTVLLARLAGTLIVGVGVKIWSMRGIYCWVAGILIVAAVGWLKGGRLSEK